jgi:hypothetical protein
MDVEAAEFRRGQQDAWQQQTIGGNHRHIGGMRHEGSLRFGLLERDRCEHGEAVLLGQQLDG